jgi:hypothetical protein
VIAILEGIKTKTRYFTPHNDTTPVTLKSICSHEGCQIKIKQKKWFSTPHRVIEGIKNHVRRKMTTDEFVGKKSAAFQVI